VVSDKVCLDLNESQLRLIVEAEVEAHACHGHSPAKPEIDRLAVATIAVY
jgi:hypothetical protein